MIIIIRNNTIQELDLSQSINAGQEIISKQVSEIENNESKNDIKSPKKSLTCELGQIKNEVLSLIS